MTLIVSLVGLLTALGLTLAVGAPRPRRVPVRVRRR